MTQAQTTTEILTDEHMEQVLDAQMPCDFFPDVSHCWRADDFRFSPRVGMMIVHLAGEQMATSIDYHDNERAKMLAHGFLPLLPHMDDKLAVDTGMIVKAMCYSASAEVRTAVAENLDVIAGHLGENQGLAIATHLSRDNFPPVLVKAKNFLFTRRRAYTA